MTDAGAGSEWGKRGTVFLVVVMIGLAIWLRFSRDDAESPSDAPTTPSAPPVPPSAAPEQVTDAPKAGPSADGAGEAAPYVPPPDRSNRPATDVRFLRPDGRIVPQVQVFGATGGVPDARSDESGFVDAAVLRWTPRFIVRWRSGEDVLSGRFADGSPFRATPFLARSIQRADLTGDVVLRPGRPVSGVVRRKNGTPAGNTVVKLYLEYVFVMSAVTDANGAFTFKEVGSDPHLIVIGVSPRTIVEKVCGGMPRVEIVLRAEDE